MRMQFKKKITILWLIKVIVFLKYNKLYLYTAYLYGVLMPQLNHYVIYYMSNGITTLLLCSPPQN